MTFYCSLQLTLFTKVLLLVMDRGTAKTVSDVNYVNGKNGQNPIFKEHEQIGLGVQKSCHHYMVINECHYLEDNVYNIII
jgi:hypothetical protein